MGTRVPHEALRYVKDLPCEGPGQVGLGDPCREYMICPLPRANDLTVPSRQPGCHHHRGGGDDLHPGCGGAGHEGPRGPHAGAQWTAAVDSGRRGVGRQRADRAAAALAVRAGRLHWTLRTSAPHGVAAIMTALQAVLATHGIPGALYTDRASWAVTTPTSGTDPDRTRLTQVGRALARLGVEHIVGFSPQARGRSERANGTLQGRLVNELRVAEIRTMAAANQYLRERFLPDYNATFGRAPADPTSAFVPIGRVDLDQIPCHEEERVVARDNTVRLDGVVLQIDKQRGRRSCATLRVVVRRHLTGQHSVWWGPRCLGRYTAQGRPLAPPFGSTAVAAPGGAGPPAPPGGV